MKRLIAIIVFLILLTGQAVAEDIYISQSGSGDGTSCVNSRSAAWFNTAGNWGGGAGAIDAGDTAHLCGTITTALTAQGSGSSGSPITIFFETNAKMSPAYCPETGCLDISGRSYITIDGGVVCGYVGQVDTACNGAIDTTATNGSTKANQQPGVGIRADQSPNCEVKNLRIALYDHDDLDDEVNQEYTGVFIPSGTTSGSTFKVHNCQFHDTCSSVQYVPGQTNDNGFQYYNNWNYDNNSGLDISNNGDYQSGYMGAALVHDNHFGTTSKWDTQTCIDGGGTPYHHNSLHSFAIPGTNNTYNSGIQFYNNLVDGDWGYCQTGALFFEGGTDGANRNIKVYNNIFKSTYNVNNNGLVTVCGDGLLEVYNNTVIGTIGTAYSVCESSTGGSAVVKFKNNISSGNSTAIIIAGLDIVSENWSNNLYACNDEYPWARDCNPGPCTYYSTLNDWKAYLGDGSEANSLFSAVVGYAKLNADGSLQVDSPARDAGVSLSGTFTIDILGITRSGTWDIGAYEYQGGPTLSTFGGISGGGFSFGQQ